VSKSHWRDIEEFEKWCKHIKEHGVQRVSPAVYSHRAVVNLGDWYIKILLMQKLGIPYREVPQYLVEGKRQELSVKRVIKKAMEELIENRHE